MASCCFFLITYPFAIFLDSQFPYDLFSQTNTGAMEAPLKSLFLDDVKRPVHPHEVPAPFSLLVEDLFQKLASVSKQSLGEFPTFTAKKHSIIEAFIKYWRTQFGSDIHPAVRLIFPNRDGRLYQLKETRVARLVVKLFQIPRKSAHYEKVMSWKKNYQHFERFYSNRRDLADLPLVISELLPLRRDEKVRSLVSVSEVNEVLDRLTETSKTEDQVLLLRPFIARLTIEEARWFMHMILKQSILSSSERAFFECWHPDAFNLYQVCKDLKKVFWALPDPDVRLAREQLQAQRMYAFVPQSSHALRISYENLCKKMVQPFEAKNTRLRQVYEDDGVAGTFVIEEKLDGDRMVLHMQRPAIPDAPGAETSDLLQAQFRFFLRRRKDYSKLYGESVHIGSLTKYLASAFAPNVSSIILDGEMVAWDFERGVVLPFGTLKSSAIQESVRQFNTTDAYEAQGSWPLFVVFDVLHYNGTDLTDLPLFWRKNLLRRLIRPVPHRFEVLSYTQGRTPKDIEDSIKAIISERGEGVMVKGMNLKYHVARRDTTWIKVKPEYLESFGENLELVVIGRIRAIKDSYMCGLQDRQNGGVYRSFCTVANGFDRAERREITRLTEHKWHDYSRNPPPPDLVTFGRKKPEQWIDPADSFVLEIKARSIDTTPEKTYAVGSTLHNLWLRCIRVNKAAEDCLSLQDYKELKLKYSSDVSKAQKVNLKRRKQPDSLYEAYNKRMRTEKVSDLFLGVVFLVLTGKLNIYTGDRISLDDTKVLVKKYGGTLVQSPYPVNFQKHRIVIVSEVLNPTTKAYAAKGFDIVRPEWIFECVRKGLVVPLEPAFVHFSENHELVSAAYKRLDEFGDSYTVTTNKDLPIDQYLTKELVVLESLEKAHFEDLWALFLGDAETITGETPLRCLFEGVLFYVVALPDMEWVSDRLKRKAQCYSGKVVSSSKDCSFVVVPAGFESGDARQELVRAVDGVSKRLSDMAFAGGRPVKIPNIVLEAFLEACVKDNQLVDPQDYRFV